jgi:hypothetical protein
LPPHRLLSPRVLKSIALRDETENNDDINLVGAERLQLHLFR